MHVLWRCICSTKNPLPHPIRQLHFTTRTHLALAHISLFLASVSFFSGPLPCLHLSDPVITADPSLDLSTAKEITPKAAEHIGLPVWSGWGEIAWSPDADKLAEALGIQEGPVGNWEGWDVCGGCYSRL